MIKRLNRVSQLDKEGFAMTIGSISGSFYYSHIPYSSAPVSPVSPTPAIESDALKSGKVLASTECKTCKSRKYQDGSDENVSFKAATHISPDAAGAAVRAHEGEHVSNAYTKAAEKNGNVINASVSIHTSVCPECGRTYVSGGTTRTMIKYENEDNPYQKNQKSLDAALLTGANVDCVA